MLQCNNCTGRSGPRQSHQTITSADLFAQPCRERVRHPKLQPRHPTSSCRRRARRWCRRRTGPGGHDGFELPRGAPRWLSFCPRSMLSSNRIDCRPSRPGPSDRAEHVCIEARNVHTRVGVKPVLVKTPVDITSPSTGRSRRAATAARPTIRIEARGSQCARVRLPVTRAGDGWDVRVDFDRVMSSCSRPCSAGCVARSSGIYAGCLACRCPTVLGSNNPRSGCCPRTDAVAGRGAGRPGARCHAHADSEPDALVDSHGVTAATGAQNESPVAGLRARPARSALGASAESWRSPIVTVR